jgi:protein SCO1/2
MNARTVIVGSGIVLMAVVALVTALVWPGYLQRDSAYAFNGGSYEPPNPASPIALADQDSAPFSIDTHRGKVVLLFFGYTYCPNFCPTTMVEVQKVKNLLGDRANEVEVVFVTVDPQRDTPARLKEYLEFFDPAFIGLSGSEDQIDAVKMQYGVFGQMQAPDASGGYLVDHSTSLYAIDPEGNLRLTWAYGTSAEDIAEDVEHLLP